MVHLALGRARRARPSENRNICNLNAPGRRGMKFQSTVFLNPGERGRSSPRFGRTPQRTREPDAMCCPRRPMKGPRQIPPKRASPLPLCVFELSFRLLIDLLVTCPEGKAAALGWELSQGCNHPSVLGVATGRLSPAATHLLSSVFITFVLSFSEVGLEYGRQLQLLFWEASRFCFRCFH